MLRLPNELVIIIAADPTLRQPDLRSLGLVCSRLQAVVENLVVPMLAICNRDGSELDRAVRMCEHLDKIRALFMDAKFLAGPENPLVEDLMTRSTKLQYLHIALPKQEPQRGEIEYDGEDISPALHVPLNPRLHDCLTHLEFFGVKFTPVPGLLSPLPALADLTFVGSYTEDEATDIVDSLKDHVSLIRSFRITLSHLSVPFLRSVADKLPRIEELICTTPEVMDIPGVEIVSDAIELADYAEALAPCRRLSHLSIPVCTAWDDSSPVYASRLLASGDVFSFSWPWYRTVQVYESSVTTACSVLASSLPSLTFIGWLAPKAETRVSGAWSPLCSVLMKGWVCSLDTGRYWPRGEMENLFAH